MGVANPSPECRPKVFERARRAIPDGDSIGLSPVAGLETSRSRLSSARKRLSGDHWTDPKNELWAAITVATAPL